MKVVYSRTLTRNMIFLTGMIMAFLIRNDDNTVSAQASSQCNVSPFSSQVLGHEEPCFCDGSRTTVCESSEICLSVPQEEDVAKLDPEDASTLPECFKVPCDDLRGNWIWVGLLPESSETNRSVWGLATIEQGEICQHPIVTFESNYVDANGTYAATPQRKTFHGLLQWRELYSFLLFDSVEERDSFESLTLLSIIANPNAANMNTQNYMFLQDFSNSAPSEQCVYYGSFLYKGYNNGPPGQNNNNTNTYIGALLRDLEGQYTLGDVVSNDDSIVLDCPEGYPRNFTVATSHDNMAGDATSSTMSTTTSTTASDTTSTDSPDNDGGSDAGNLAQENTDTSGTSSTSAPISDVVGNEEEDAQDSPRDNSSAASSETSGGRRGGGYYLSIKNSMGPIFVFLNTRTIVVALSIWGSL